MSTFPHLRANSEYSINHFCLDFWHKELSLFTFEQIGSYLFLLLQRFGYYALFRSVSSSNLQGMVSSIPKPCSRHRLIGNKTCNN